MTARNTPGAVPVGAAREDGAGADAAPRRALAEGVDRVDGLGLTVDGTSILDQVGNTPLVAAINCTLWVIYALFKPQRDIPVALANAPGIVLILCKN